VDIEREARLAVDIGTVQIASRNIAPRLTSLLLATVATLVLLAAAAAASATASIQLGVYVREASGSPQILNEYTSLVGREPAVVMWYRGLEDPLMYSSEASNLSGRTATPLVSLEPVDPSGKDLPLSEVAAGTYDSYIRKQAQATKAWGRRIIIRFAYEMNLGPRADIPWGGTLSPTAGNTATDYVAAWRHVVSIFRAEGASNAEFVWAPNVDDGGIPFTSYFPGDEWVDAVGLDGYNWGSTAEASGHKWLSLGDTFESSYKTLTQLSSKPVMITETASTEQGGSKPEWIRKGFLSELPQKFPRINTVVWFDVAKETDWRVNSSQSSLEAFREVANSSLYGGSTPYTAPVEEAPPVVVEEVQVTKKIHGNPKKRRVTRSAVRRGTIRYRLSRRTAVQILIEQRSRPARHVRLRRHGHAGLNTLHFSTKVAGHRLKPGSYTVTVSAVDGQRSQKKAGFRVLGR
jgi:hypothetical protein